MTALTVNGQPVRYRLAPETPLLFALRDVSNLTGTKYGCGTGECGACTVHVDGKAARACRVSIAQAEGTFVTTIEALSRDRGHPVQQALAAEGAVQCGFCTPGIVMAAAALIAARPDPADAEIDVAIHHLCRCGVQPRLRRAIHRAARAARGEEAILAAPPPGIDPADAARAVPALAPVKR
ncbi:MAG TPA: (2Fe-2S)-binding protein [Sphingomonas sp.]|nr:(2Fe-2S)-binding protein [Sphingomonas sp.]